MRNLILDKLAALQKERSNMIPANPNEMQLMEYISGEIHKEMNSMIEDGTIKVAGITVNKIRIITT